MNINIWYGTPADAPDIRGSAGGTTVNPPSSIGVYPGAPTVTNLTYGGVPYKFQQTSTTISSDDPVDGSNPTDWQDLDRNGAYRIFAFIGLPDPTLI